MSNNEINKEAYKQAEKELLKEKVDRVKEYILETLRKMESKKKEKAKVEEELRVLKLNLDDLRNGRFDKLEERIESHIFISFLAYCLEARYWQIGLADPHRAS